MKDRKGTIKNMMKFPIMKGHDHYLPEYTLSKTVIKSFNSENYLIVSLIIGIYLINIFLNKKFYLSNLNYENSTSNDQNIQKKIKDLQKIKDKIVF